jgi:hypothetical protein
MSDERRKINWWVQKCVNPLVRVWHVFPEKFAAVNIIGQCGNSKNAIKILNLFL